METERFNPPFVQGSITQLGSGRRSTAYKIDNEFVIKQIRSEHEHFNNLDALKKRLSWEYTLLKKYLGDFVLDTSFVRGIDNPESQSPQLYIVQPLVSGLSFEEGFHEALRLRQDMSKIKEFFKKSLVMTKETGFIPDFFGPRVNPLEWYNPLKSRNVLIRKEENTYSPIIIDTNFTVRAHTLDGRMIHTPALALAAAAHLAYLNLKRR